MLAPQACVAVEVAGPPAAQEQRFALEQRCSEILGAGRCRIVVATSAEPRGACWHARVTAEGGATPTDASVVLTDDTEPDHAPVRRDVTFRPNDAVAERWATLGLVIAALVTVEEHSAAEAAPPAGAVSAPVIEARPPPAPPIPFVGGVGAAGVGSVGLLPGAALGARVDAYVGVGHVALLGRFTAYPAQSRAQLGAGGAGGDFDLASGGLGLCGLLTRGRWGGRACAGGDLLRAHAQGLGVTETNTLTVSWQALWVGAVAELRVARHLELALALEAAAALHRPTFAITNTPSVFSPAPVSGAAALGVEVPF
jgi:hypothetical protein